MNEDFVKIVDSNITGVGDDFIKIGSVIPGKNKMVKKRLRRRKHGK